MEIKKEILKDAYAIRLSMSDDKEQIARAYLYILTNSLHEKPFGFLEDVFVEKTHRGGGAGTKIVEAAIAEAKKAGCYKLIGTSRESRPEVHRFYEHLGFKKRGFEFRIDF